MNKSKIVLVTGLSGAGKTSAMAVLEDLGYHCMDRFPTSMVDKLIKEIHEEKDPRYKKMALSVSANDFEEFYTKMKHGGFDLTVLFLDASKKALLLRYKYSRRHHPLIVANLANSLEEAIDAEIKDLSKIRNFSTLIIDTSFLTQQDLSSRIQRFFTHGDKRTLSISFISFGYRHGIPLDADLVFDVRFLNNPYWEEALREKSGNDMEVYSYVMEDDVTVQYLDHFIPFLDYSLKRYIDESKHHLTVAIGCTGGQHRSVSFVNYLHKHYKKNFSALKNHRDVEEVVE